MPPDPSPPLPPGFKKADILPAALTVATLVIATVLFRFFMVPYEQWINFDEGCEAAAVERIISGHWLPYVDAAAIRGPFLYWTQGILQALTGRFEYTGTRLLSLFCGLCTVSMTFLAGWAAGWPLAGAIGGATYIFVIAVVYPVGAGMGVVGESVAIAYLATAFFLVGYALYRARSERGRITLLALGGFVFGMAGLTKQTQIIACGPMFVWIFARSIGEGWPPPWRAILGRRLLPFGAGGLGLLTLVLLRYALAGQLGTFFFWSMSYGTNIYMKPYKGRVLRLMSQWFVDQPWAIMAVVLALVVGLGRPLATIEGRSARGILAGLRDSAFELTVGLMSLVLLVAALMPLRLWGNYFVLVFPFFGMTLGILLERPDPPRGQGDLAGAGAGGRGGRVASDRDGGEPFLWAELRARPRRLGQPASGSRLRRNRSHRRTRPGGDFRLGVGGGSLRHLPAAFGLHVHLHHDGRRHRGPLLGPESVPGCSRHPTDAAA